MGVKSLSVVAAVLLAWFAYERLNPPVSYPPGVLIPDNPLQSEITPEDSPFTVGKFQLTPLAHFALDARVLHRKTYRYDRQAALAPVDLAVGWGPMSDQAVLDQLQISQSHRFFFYEWAHSPPLEPNDIIAHATNLHLIPANNEVEEACKSLRSGELIHLEGLLVEATGPGIGTWRSSLTRTDSGNGACELVWLQSVRPLR